MSRNSIRNCNGVNSLHNTVLLRRPGLPHRRRRRRADNRRTMEQDGLGFSHLCVSAHDGQGGSAAIARHDNPPSRPGSARHAAAASPSPPLRLRACAGGGVRRAEKPGAISAGAQPLARWALAAAGPGPGPGSGSSDAAWERHAVVESRRPHTSRL